MSKSAGLGRGLSALLGEQAQPTQGDLAPRTGGVREVEIASIRPNPDQPRVQFDEAALDELARSISARGVLQPILLRPVADGYEIVAGERRWRAAQRAQLHAIPAIVRDIDDSSMAEVALIENIQRQDLNAIEEADGYRQLIERYGHSHEDVGRIVHKSRSHVANLLRLLDLPDSVQSALLRSDISMGHARAVASAPDPASLTAEIISKGLSVRQAEALAKSSKPESKGDAAKDRVGAPVDADLAALERQLGDLLGLKVKVANSGTSGAVTLHYTSLDQLDMICQRLSGEPI
jgi:ParB family chromosome partitioning protein